MKKVIKASYGRTVNLGNFENVKIQASIAEEIAEDDTRSNKGALTRLFKQCEDFVLEKCEIEAFNNEEK